MLTKPQFPREIFYDGSCSVCAREIEHYLRLDHGGKLLAVDISSPGFAPGLHRITLEDFMYELHVIDKRGEIDRGVEAFQELLGLPEQMKVVTILGIGHPAEKKEPVSADDLQHGGQTIHFTAT